MARSIKIALAAMIVVSLAVPIAWTQDEAPSVQPRIYRIGPRDLLEISVFELPELNQTVRVDEDGSMTLKLLGRIEVDGLTAQELEKKLAVILDKQFTKAAHVTVFIKEYQKVSVIGAVGRAGQYELVGPTTLIEIIGQAGGLTTQAMNEIFIYRKSPGAEPTIIGISLEDFVNGTDKANIELKPNDVVSVPIDQLVNVFVFGEVRTPGAVSYLRSKRITLLQAIAEAGGPTEWAKKSKVTIKRTDKQSGKEIKIAVNLKRMISGKIADIALEEGDIVIVP